MRLSLHVSTFALSVILVLLGLNSHAKYTCKDLLLTSAFTKVSGIEEIREIISSRGLTLALDWNARDINLSSEELWYLGGAKVILVDGIKGKKVIPGVVLHLGPTSLWKKVKGDYNPYQVLTEQEAKKFENKLEEARKIIAADPMAYPRTVFVSEMRLAKENSISHEIVLSRLESFFTQMHAQFPEGFIVKHAYEFKSGDSKTGPVLSGKATPEKLMRHFFAMLPHVQRWAKEKHINFGDKDFERRIFTTDWDPYFAITYALLMNPENLMVQEKIKINEEFRADYIAGQTMNIQPRYGKYYKSTNAQTAATFLDKVLMGNNWELQYLAGGSDIVGIEGAKPRFVILELNLGGESAYIDPLYLPLSANTFLSSLLGYPTPLMRDLIQLKHQSRQAQNSFIKKFELKFLQHLDGGARKDAINEFRDYFNSATDSRK